MNAMQVRGQWNQFRGEVRKRWCGLTGDDVGRMNGRMLKVLGKVQEKCGRAKAAAGKQWRKVTHH